MKNKNALTIEMIDRRLAAQENKSAGMDALFEKYFRKPEGDLARPSKEIALYLFEKSLNSGYEEYLRPVWMSSMLELGYITFSELMALEKSEKVVLDRDLLCSLLYTKKFSFPETLEEMEAATSTLKPHALERLAYLLLRKEVHFKLRNLGPYNKEAWENLKSNYVKLMDKFFVYFAENSCLREEKIWTMCYYIPTNVITNRFKESLTHKEVEDAFALLARYGRNGLPFSQLVELIDYFKALPFASSRFPYDERCGMSFMLERLSRCAEEISESDSALKVKLYNLFIKPLKANPSMLQDLGLDSSKMKYVIIISATLVPTSELITFIDTVLIPTEIQGYQNKRKIVKEIAHTRSQTKIPVSVEFINMQDEYEVGESLICFNNDCINDVNFWLKRAQKLGLKDRRGYSREVFPPNLRYNNSFLNWFKPRTEDIPVYKEICENYLMDALAMSKVRNLTKEFIKAFCGMLNMNFMHKDVLANVIDMDILTTIIENSKPTMDVPGELFRLNVPEELFRVNSSFDAAFFAKYAKELGSFCNRSFVGESPNIRLADVVSLLE